MKIRFMCMKHECDLGVEGLNEGNTAKSIKPEYIGHVVASTLCANGDGTYEFDLSWMFCPEFDTLAANLEQRYRTTGTYDHVRWQEELDGLVCSKTWTAVIYSNFNKGGE